MAFLIALVILNVIAVAFMASVTARKRALKARALAHNR